MRYRLLPDGATMSPVQNTGDMVALTVWFTLICGIVLLGLGVYGKGPGQNYLVNTEGAPLWLQQGAIRGQ